MSLSSDEFRQLDFRIESLQRLMTKQLARHSQYPIPPFGLEAIRFEILTASCVNKTATGQVLSRPCGKSVITGEDTYEVVDLVDPIGDKLVGGDTELEGLEGYALYMKDDYTGDCRWEIIYLECDANACVP